MLSFWERHSFVNYDYIIIGGGIVGLSTAISLKEKENNADILVLERGIFPSGASTKNAGFACFGSLTELLLDIEAIGEGATLKLVEERWKGLLKLRKRLGDEKIDFRCYGGYELINSQHIDCFQKIDKVNELLYPLFREQVYVENKQVIKEFGFSQQHIESVIFNKFEGQIDTGKMMKNLIHYANSLGINIITGAEVVGFEENKIEVKLKVKSSVYREEINFSSQKLAICTNAFTKSLLPNLELNPGRGTVLVTAPIKNLKFKGVFHFDEGYYYFRNFGDRVLLGGGRNLDFQTETSTEFEINQMIYAALVQKLDNIILPGQSFEIESSWAGIMAFGSNKLPVLKMHSERIAVGVRLGGMGVAIGSRMGDRLAALISN